MAEILEVRPQPRQEVFLSSSADIAVFGGSAGGGKTWGLLLEPIRHITNPEFGAVIFRRTIPEITHEGALWDESKKIYPLLDGKPNDNDKQFKFPKGSKITISNHALLNNFPAAGFIFQLPPLLPSPKSRCRSTLSRACKLAKYPGSASNSF